MELVINITIVFTALPLIIMVTCTFILYHRIIGHTSASLYIITLFLSDCLMLITIGIIALNRHNFYTMQIASCRVLALIYYASCTYSFSMLAVISTNRYKLLHRRKVQVLHPKHASSFTTISVFVCASLMCAAPASLFVNVTQNDQTAVVGYCVILFNYTQVQKMYLAFKLTMLLIWGVFPVLILSFFYSVFYKTLRSTDKTTQKKTLFFVSMLLLSFLVIQIPYIVVTLFELSLFFPKRFDCQWNFKRLFISIIVRFIPHVHCLANPIIYALSGTEFREKISACIHCELFDKKQFLRQKSNVRVHYQVTRTKPHSHSSMN